MLLREVIVVRSLLSASVVAALLSASTFASADETAFPDLFGDDGLTPSDSATAHAVSRVADLCQRFAGSREGAGPAEDGRCRAAVAAVSAKGRGATAAILERLDDARTPYYARSRYLELLARSGDERAVGPLAKALGRVLDREKAGAPSLTTEEVDDVLEKTTGTDPGAEAPWAATADDQVRHKAQADAWRAWAEKHAGMSAAEMRRASVAEDRAAASDADAGKAFVAATRLAEHPATREEGRKALQALRARTSLPEGALKFIDEELANLPGGAPVAPPPPVGKSKKGAASAIGS